MATGTSRTNMATTWDADTELGDIMYPAWGTDVNATLDDKLHKTTANGQTVSGGVTFSSTCTFSNALSAVNTSTFANMNVTGTGTFANASISTGTFTTKLRLPNDTEYTNTQAADKRAILMVGVYDETVASYNSSLYKVEFNTGTGSGRLGIDFRDGITVTGFTVYASCNTTAGETISAFLFRRNNISTSQEIMANFSNSFTNTATGYTKTSIAYATVDNSTYEYDIMLERNNSTYTATVYSIIVGYTYKKP